jgi:hypothetical protein
VCVSSNRAGILLVPQDIHHPPFRIVIVVYGECQGEQEDAIREEAEIDKGERWML